MTSAARPTLRIDFVSDVVCPWCAVGLAGLEHAIDALRDSLAVELHFHPFELNPTMGPEGEDAAAYLKAKYGLNDEQLRSNRDRIAERGKEAGFIFGERQRIWGTFDAHRLLAWARDVGGAEAQLRLKRHLLEAYHRDGRNPSDHGVLLDLVRASALDVDKASAVLRSDAFAHDVREAQAAWRSRGVTAVPAAIVNDRYLIAGGQPADVYKRTLEQITQQRAAR